MKKNIKEFVKNNLLNYICIIFYIFRIFKIDEKKIVIINFRGKGYGDSPKYIAEELLKNNHDYKIRWIVKKRDNSIPKEIKQIKIYSIKYFYELSTAKIWINNSRFPIFVRKRKKQYYIQTWHSPLRLKKIEKDAIESMSKYYKKVMYKDSKNINLMISGCDFSHKIYSNSFLYNGEILKCGTPRCDIFFNRKKCMEYRIKIDELYQINKKKEIVLYAPTFRNNEKNEEFLIDFDYISKKLPSNIILLVRFHPHMNVNIKKYDNILNVTDYPDMQELLCATDYLITDYSSSCFDALIANKKCILFVKDLKKYLSKERNLYFDINNLPFPHVKSEDELIRILEKFDKKNYKKEIDEFNEYIGLYENGKASSKLVERINEVIYGKKI